MSIDLSSETILSLTQAAKSLPGRPHASSIWRWYTRGIRGVKLETTVIAGRRFTSREALQRFAERCTASAVGGGEPIPHRTTRQRQAAIQRAERDVADDGS